MSGWEIATLALLVGGMVPALVLVARADRWIDSSGWSWRPRSGP
ncbi:hypothetical protein [Kutzneria kofuensis]